VSPVLPFAFPLDEFYLWAGITLPRIERIDGEAVPEPYKSLPCIRGHDADIGTISWRHHPPEVLRREVRDDFYFREVVLKLTAVKHRGIRRHSDRSLLFAAGVRRLILMHLPLGHILKDCGVAHSSRPKAF
jgi:hypothetical protein